MRRTELHPNQIRRYRHMRHLTLRNVADLGDLSDPAIISNWEKGRKLPTLISALKLSASIHCPVEVLYSDYHKKFWNVAQERKNTINHI